MPQEQLNKVPPSILSLFPKNNSEEIFTKIELKHNSSITIHTRKNNDGKFIWGVLIPDGKDSSKSIHTSRIHDTVEEADTEWLMYSLEQSKI
jgi:hypothetical protein